MGLNGNKLPTLLVFPILLIENGGKKNIQMYTCLTDENLDAIMREILLDNSGHGERKCQSH